MNKKRLTLLLDDAQIRVIKSKAALSGMTGSQWIIDQLALDTAQEDQVPDVDTALDAQDTPQDVSTTHVDPDPQADPEPVTADLVPDCTGKEIPIEERDLILIRLDAAMPGSDPDTIKSRVDLLNEKKVPVITTQGPRYGGVWDPKKFSNNRRLAQERAAKKNAAAQ